MNKLLALLVIGGVAACSPDEEQPEPPLVAEEAEIPSDEVPGSVSPEDLSAWRVRLDDASGDSTGFQIVVEEGGLSARTGPAGIAWRATDLVLGGDFQASATFDQRGATPGNQEGYGLVIGGRNLESPDQAYTYFLVRSTGDYMIKRREGEETRTIVDWTANPAVKKLEGAGTGPANMLAVRVEGGQARFSVNGTEVHALPADDVAPYGLAGVRVNHNLAVGVRDWSVTGAMVGQEVGGG